MGKVKVDAYKCERCGHVWVPRSYDNEPEVCPKCKSPYWNRPRKRQTRKARQHIKGKEE